MAKRAGRMPSKMDVSLYKVPHEQVLRPYGPWRGLTSPHTSDLKWLVGAVLFLLGLVSWWLWSSIGGDMRGPTVPLAESTNDDGTQTHQDMVPRLMQFITDDFRFGVFVGALTAVVAVLARAYVEGKRRFAIIDLVSSEMFTNWRLFGVNGTAQGFIAAHQYAAARSNELRGGTTDECKSYVDYIRDQYTVKEKQSRLRLGGEKLPATIPSDFLTDYSYSANFDKAMEGVGALHADCVNFITDYYSMLKHFQEMKKNFLKLTEDCDSRACVDLLGLTELMLYLVDSMALSALNAFSTVVQRDTHKHAAWRMVLHTALPINQYLVENLQEGHSFRFLSEGRRKAYAAYVHELKKHGKKKKAPILRRDDILEYAEDP